MENFLFGFKGIVWQVLLDALNQGFLHSGKIGRARTRFLCDF